MIVRMLMLRLMMKAGISPGRTKISGVSLVMKNTCYAPVNTPDGLRDFLEKRSVH